MGSNPQAPSDGTPVSAQGPSHPLTGPQGPSHPLSLNAKTLCVWHRLRQVFYLYCRTAPGKPWYPVSAMKGDGQSKGLINAWLNSPVAKTVFKDRLDEGMARSIYDSERRLASMAVEQYRNLKDNQARLQWGFKVLSIDVLAKEKSGDIEKQKIVPVNRGMLKEGVMEQAQAAMGNVKLPELPKEVGGVKLPEVPKMPKIDMPKMPWG